MSWTAFSLALSSWLRVASIFVRSSTQGWTRPLDAPRRAFFGRLHRFSCLSIFLVGVSSACQHPLQSFQFSPPSMWRHTVASLSLASMACESLRQYSRAMVTFLSRSSTSFLDASDISRSFSSVRSCNSPNFVAFVLFCCEPSPTVSIQDSLSRAPRSSSIPL